MLSRKAAAPALGSSAIIVEFALAGPMVARIRTLRPRGVKLRTTIAPLACLPSRWAWHGAPVAPRQLPYSYSWRKEKADVLQRRSADRSRRARYPRRCRRRSRLPPPRPPAAAPPRRRQHRPDGSGRILPQLPGGLDRGGGRPRQGGGPRDRPRHAHRRMESAVSRRRDPRTARAENGRHGQESPPPLGPRREDSRRPITPLPRPLIPASTT